MITVDMSSNESFWDPYTLYMISEDHYEDTRDIRELSNKDLLYIITNKTLQYETQYNTVIEELKNRDTIYKLLFGDL